MNKKINTLKKILICTAILLTAGCTNDLEQEAIHTALQEGEVSLQWLAPNMGIHHVTTRVADPKTEAEQRINNVHVFIFDAEGNYLTPKDNDAFQGYRYVEGTPNLVLQTEMFGDQQKAANATIVAVANMPQNEFGELIDGQGNPATISDLDDLDTHVFHLDPFTTSLPESGLPMVGRVTGVNLSSENTAAKVQLIQMKSLMARIDLDFTMDPYQSSDNKRNPSLLINEVLVNHFPDGGTILPQQDNQNITTTEHDNINVSTKETEVKADDFIGHTIREGEPQELTIYMLEHARPATTKEAYPENIDEIEKQRYKNELADSEAAYITLKGIYTNHNDYAYHVTYTIYPGANATDDFTIKANCQYKNNITVKGITVNSEGEEALLDTRVNIDTEANPYFIEMLREREFDAHFNVTPMDVFIYEPGGKVTVSILPDENNQVPDWIRMEPMKYAPDEVNPNKAFKATKAGEGKRKYFTENLVTETLNKNNYNTSYTISSEETQENHYEERIYFYVDENVPSSNDGQEVPSREATLEIKYEAPGKETQTRTILLRQAGLLPVFFNKFTNFQGNEHVAYTFYIEYYEEYLEHYDGKNSYNETYEGLEWGFDGVYTGLGGANWWTNLDYGWYNTMSIMKQFRNTSPQPNPLEIDLNTRPRGAAEYCYNKNKRNKDGQVETCHWYLPTISELEYAMETWYGRFDVFQNNWYWSSNPGSSGTNNTTDIGESPYYARATITEYNPANRTYQHIQSAADWPYDQNDTPWQGTISGQGGYARRGKIFRIRAAYIYEAPTNKDYWGQPVPRIE